MVEFEQVEVLLVEDNAADAELALRALKRHHFANKVFWVKDGAEALDYLFCAGAYKERRLDHPPRLVLLDIKLPKVDGIEVLQRIKNDERTRTIPTVMLTSSAEERDIIGSYKLGVNSYIVKPLDFEQFAESVSQLGFYWMLLNKTPA